jgi:hypothetical protein
MLTRHGERTDSMKRVSQTNLALTEHSSSRWVAMFLANIPQVGAPSLQDLAADMRRNIIVPTPNSNFKLKIHFKHQNFSAPILLSHLQRNNATTRHYCVVATTVFREHVGLFQQATIIVSFVSARDASSSPQLSVACSAENSVVVFNELTFA